VTDLQGRAWSLLQPHWLCTNGSLHEALLELDPLNA